MSPGAAALRVALEDAGEPIRASRCDSAAMADTRKSFGPVAANDVAADAARFGMFWSPVLDGDIATIEVHVDVGVRDPRCGR